MSLLMVLGKWLQKLYTVHLHRELYVYMYIICQLSCCGVCLLPVGVDIWGPADESTLTDENLPLGGFLVTISVPLQVSDREESV